MLTYLLGPVLALLPKPWRDSLPAAKEVIWGRATAISGFLEFVAALIGLSQWYAHVMSTWVGYGVSQALDGKMGPEVRFQDIGGAGLIIWATQPLTWLLGYLAAEGVVRLCAGAFSGSACGILPLYLTDRILFRPFRRRGASPVETGPGMRANASSFASAVREKMQAGKRRDVPDELCFSQDESVDILEVNSCQRKPDWTPPRIVRYQASYYRLEESENGTKDRPFRYRLRRLAAGVPGRGVLLYTPADPIIRELVATGPTSK